MGLTKINWFALIGGSLLLLLLPLSFYFPWWQLTIGESLLEANVSPINTNFGFLTTHFTIPVIWALNITSILIFIASGIVMLIYSIRPTKSYSKDLLSFAYRKPLYAVVLCIVGLLITIFTIQAILDINIPLIGTGTLDVPSGFTRGINISIIMSSGFQWPFWLAIVAAVLCIVARIYHIRIPSS